MNDVLSAVEREVARARTKYPAFHSQHEGYAVIREELDELWDSVKQSKDLRASGTTGIEAIQIAAMAVRFALDLCDADELFQTLYGYERTR